MKMNDKIIDMITNIFFIIIGILAIILTIRLFTIPTKNYYKVYNDKNNYVVIEESR